MLPPCGHLTVLQASTLLHYCSALLWEGVGHTTFKVTFCGCNICPGLRSVLLFFFPAVVGARAQTHTHTPETNLYRLKWKPPPDRPVKKGQHISIIYNENTLFLICGVFSLKTNKSSKKETIQLEIHVLGVCVIQRYEV